jgi:hypothetical protein
VGGDGIGFNGWFLDKVGDDGIWFNGRFLDKVGGDGICNGGFLDKVGKMFDVQAPAHVRIFSLDHICFGLLFF